MRSFLLTTLTAPQCTLIECSWLSSLLIIALERLLKNIFTFYYNFTECFSLSRSSLNQILLNITDSLITDTIINNKLSEDWRLEWAALTRRHWESQHWTQSVATRSYISRADNTIFVTLSNVALLREQNISSYHRALATHSQHFCAISSFKCRQSQTLLSSLHCPRNCFSLHSSLDNRVVRYILNSLVLSWDQWSFENYWHNYWHYW